MYIYKILSNQTTKRPVNWSLWMCTDHQQAEAQCRSCLLVISVLPTANLSQPPPVSQPPVVPNPSQLALIVPNRPQSPARLRDTTHA